MPDHGRWQWTREAAVLRLARLVCFYVDRPPVDRAADACSEHGLQATVLRCDVGDPVQLAALAGRVEAERTPQPVLGLVARTGVL